MMTDKLHRPRATGAGRRRLLVLVLLLATAAAAAILYRQPLPVLPAAPEPEVAPAPQHLAAEPRTVVAPPAVRQAPAMPAMDVLSLRGIFASAEPALSLAIIANQAGLERYFMIGDTVFESAVLEEIHPYHVVLLRDGRRRVLRLSAGALEYDVPPPLAEQRGRLLSDYRRAILTGDLDRFVGIAGYRPAYRGSEFHGFEIVSQGAKGDAFLEQLGLQQGDVVISINGHELATDMRYMQNLAGNIKALSDVQIGVERGGTILFFDYALEAGGSAGAAPPADVNDGPGEAEAPVNPVLQELLSDE